MKFKCKQGTHQISENNVPGIITNSYSLEITQYSGLHQCKSLEITHTPQNPQKPIFVYLSLPSNFFFSSFPLINAKCTMHMGANDEETIK